MRHRGGRMRPLDLLLLLVMAAVALRAVIISLPAPLLAKKTSARIWIYVSAVPSGLAAVLPKGEIVRENRAGSSLGRVIQLRARPSLQTTAKAGWVPPIDILIQLAATGRYRRGSGFYVARNQLLRIGENYPLRTSLGVFTGRLERIVLGDAE